MKKSFVLVMVSAFCFVSIPIPKSDAYSVRFGWENPDPPADEILVRIALTRKDIESCGDGSLFLEESLPPGTTSYDIEVVPELYGGYYLSITLVIAGEEGPPVIISEKPGNVVGTSCDIIGPPLGFRLAVTSPDVSRLVWYLRYMPIVPPPNPAFPAGEQERCDFSGDGRITSADYSFLLYILRFYPIMADRPVWRVL